MRILHVTHFLDQGGSETMILTLAQEQRRMGHDAWICSIFGEGPLDSRAAELGIPTVRLHSPNKRVAKIQALSGFLRKERFDVLHSHWGSWLTVAIAGLRRGVPRVHTNHSNQRRLWAAEHRLASMFTDKVVSLTPVVEPYLSKWVGVPQRKIVVIPNGAELGPFANAIPADLEGIPPGALVVGMVARLSPPKDYGTFIEAAGIVQRTHPGVHFIAVGQGPQRELFEAQVRQLGLERFHFLGGRSDVPAILKRLSVAVLATRHEGLPFSLVEAMAAGVACVGSDIPSLRFTLDEGRAGLLVPGANAAALADAIQGLLDHPEQRQKLVERGLSYVQRFDSVTMAEGYLQLYGSVMKAARG